MPRGTEIVTTYTSRKTDQGNLISDVIRLRTKEEIDWEAFDWNSFAKEWQIPSFSPRDLIDVNQYSKLVPLKEIPFKARGAAARLLKEGDDELGGLPENLNPYLRTLILLTGGPAGPVGKQFIAQVAKENPSLTDSTYIGFTDSLNEAEHEEVQGIVNKYKNRVLFITTGNCAAYCRFCTRGRLVGEEPAKTIAEIESGFTFIEQDEHVREIIFSGGDPFTLPPETFRYIIDRLIQLQESGRIDSVRFGSRLLVHTGQIPEYIFTELERLPLSPHVMLHVNHPSEITLQVKQGMDKLRKTGSRIYTQSVLLAGVNDEREIMKQLLTKIDKFGGIPYYVFTCDPVTWGAHFKVGLEKIREIFWQLRAELPGVVGMVRIVIDVPGGYGKITLDEGFWISKRMFKDNHGTVFMFDEHENVVPYDGTQPATASEETTVFQGHHNID